MSRIALISRSIEVASGGGIGAYVVALAQLLSRDHEVTVITTDANAGVLPIAFADRSDKLNVVLVPEPGPRDVGSFNNFLHAWSSVVYETLVREFPGGGPDLVEFPDYLGEGAVTAQAKRCLDPALRNTSVLVRLHSTAEICSVLNGSLNDGFETRTVFDLERYTLANSDHLLYAGGDVLGTYERFYGTAALSPPVLARHPVTFSDVRPLERQGTGWGEPLRLLYLGRLERRKGVQNLVRGLCGLPVDGWELSLIGNDTRTGPLGTSMHELLEVMASGDERIQVRGAVPHDQVPFVIDDHDILLQPSRWECWPNVVLEALAHNRPVLATPVGGLVEMVQTGRSGLVARGTRPDDLAGTVETAVRNRASLEGIVQLEAPRSHFDLLTSQDHIRETYAALAGRSRRFPVPRGDRRRESAASLLSVIVPYYRLDDFVEETVASIFKQTYRPLEVIIVNDGSFYPEDRCLARIATRYPIHVVSQPNAGLSAARNFGIAQSRGTYVLPLDADNAIEPDFALRCINVLESDPATSFVTSWTRYIDEDGHPLPDQGGYQPMSNTSTTIHRNNVAGDAVAVFRRSLFDDGFWYHPDLTSYEDWFHYRLLHEAGHFGHAIPERLIRYRVRTNSMLREIGEPHLGHLVDEMAAHLREEEVQWTSTNG